MLHDNGQPRSIATGTPPNPVPTGLTAKVITDAEFTGLTAGTHRWDAPTVSVVVDTAKAALAANQQSVRDYIANARPALQAIAGRSPASFSNIAGGQSAVRACQQDLATIANGLLRVGRMLLDDYTGTD